MRTIEVADKALYDNIQQLSDLLLKVLRRHEPVETLEILESILKQAKRDQSSKYIQQINVIIQSLPKDKILSITRAFAHFLNLTEIAEQYHRVRRGREYQRLKKALQPGSLAFALPAFIRKGILPDALYQAVCKLKIELVLTAHPTEATRRTLIHKYGRIAEGLAELDRLDLTPKEKDNVINALEIEIESAWLTNEIRLNKPSAVEEAKWGFAVVQQSLWQALPQMMRDLDEMLFKVTAKNLPWDIVPIQFSSWMGGDRDGNPNVTAATTKEVIYLARKIAADLYWTDINKLQDALSMSACNEALRKRVGDVEMPYRVLLSTVKARLHQTKRWAENQGALMFDKIYRDPADLLEPLVLCYHSLLETGAETIAKNDLLDLIRRVHAFGLVLLPLDLRQDASKHTDLMNELTIQLKEGDYKTWSEKERQAYLNNKIKQLSLEKLTDLPQHLVLTPASQEALDTFRLITEHPRDSFNSYIISMTAHPSDILLVFYLQKMLGITKPLRIVPLFETLVDLENAAHCIDELLNIDIYKSACEGSQEILIGYSDSAKDAGFLAAAWAQYQAQEALMAVGERHQIRIVFFHGRGGSTGRGGGPTHLAIRSQPPGSIQGRLRITQQGEVIRHRFGMQKIAERTLSIYITATLEAMLLPEPLPKREYRDLMQNLAQVSLHNYQQTVKENPRFMRYFETVTPIHELDKLTIASRPTRRGLSGGIKSLRAIPWIFAWTQNRLLLPAWLGVGEALSFYLGNKTHQAKDWLFFSSLLNMIEMVLAKAAPDITEQYEARLVSEDLWDMGIEYRGAFLKTKNCLLKILKQSKLLSKNSILERSIQVRNPYLLSLHLLQIELLSRYRNDQAQRDREINIDIERALLVSIEGIAAGMHNTG